MLLRLDSILLALCACVRATLPFWEESNYTDLAAAVQDTYCNSVSSSNFSVGSDKLLKSLDYGEGEQKINVYHSDKFGIVVAYQGTNSSSLDDQLHDYDLAFWPPDKELGIASDALIFHGWLVQFRKSWDDLKPAIQSALSEYPSDKVVVSGHSMGSAIAQLGALAIYHEFGNVLDKVVAFAPPRVGNLAYAAAFDSVLKGSANVSSYTGVWNGDDWVPALPLYAWGFVHPSGMIWIKQENGTDYSYYSNTEDPFGPAGPTHVDHLLGLVDGDILYWGAHDGFYMKTQIGASSGPCPAIVGGGVGRPAS